MPERSKRYFNEPKKIYVNDHLCSYLMNSRFGYFFCLPISILEVIEPKIVGLHWLVRFVYDMDGLECSIFPHNSLYAIFRETRNLFVYFKVFWWWILCPTLSFFRCSCCFLNHFLECADFVCQHIRADSVLEFLLSLSFVVFLQFLFSNILSFLN